MHTPRNEPYGEGYCENATLIRTNTLCLGEKKNVYDSNNPSFLCGREMEALMLNTLAIVIIVLWLLGTVTSYTMGGFIHILLVIAIVMLLVNFISGRKRL